MLYTRSFVISRANPNDYLFYIRLDALTKKIDDLCIEPYNKQQSSNNAIVEKKKPEKTQAKTKGKTDKVQNTVEKETSFVKAQEQLEQVKAR